jgi:hypothetical protein
MSVIETLIKRYRPAAVVLEDIDCDDYRKGIRARETTILVRELCSRLGVPIFTVTDRDIRDAIGAPKQVTKQQLAQAITNQFSSLIRHLPAPKKAWQSEDKRLSMFVAVAMALAANDR